MCQVMIILLTGLLCACQQINDKRSQYVRNRELDYVNSTLIAPLKVPHDLTLEQRNDIYPIPYDLPAIGSLKPVNIEPPGFGKLEG